MVLQTWFVQLQTNKFQGFFKDFSRTNYSFQGLRFYSINRHYLTPFWTQLAKTRHRVEQFPFLKLRIYENLLWELRGEELHDRRASQLYTQLLQLWKESLKKFRLVRDSNPWPLRYRCSALPTGSRSLNWIVINPWKDDDIIIDILIYYEYINLSLSRQAIGN